MDFRVRVPVVWVSVLVLCAWFFMPFFKSNDMGYSVRDFNEDMSKIYYDLGKLSQKRGDFQNAIKSYSLALAHNPDHSICMRNIDYCKESLSRKISGAVEFFAKLDKVK